jgi:phage/plasmid-like protein (TIGR03299 family)
MKQEMNSILNQAGLNWKVSQEAIQTVSGIEIPEKIALVRDDTQKCLGIHTENYVPYQNEELLELLFRISQQTGLELHSGGSFKEGARVWFQLKSNDMILGNDKIEGYISGFNSFDGRTSLGFGNSNLTVSCQNTFWKAYASVESKLRHSANMKPRIEEILRKIDVLLVEEQNTFQTIQRLGNIRMTQEVKDLVVRRLFEIDREERLDNPDFSTNKKNRMSKFYVDLNGEINQKGDNLWGLFSGVTKYTTHSMKKGDNSENKIFGKTGNIERNIFSSLVEMV